MIVIAIFGAYYVHLPSCKDCHWKLITHITHISLAKDCPGNIWQSLQSGKYA